MSDWLPEHHRRLLEEMPVALSVFRVARENPAASRCVYRNPAVEHQSAALWPLGGAIGDNGSSRIGVGGDSAVLQRLVRTMTSGTSETLEFSYDHGEHGCSWYRTHFVPLGGNLVAALYENITHRKLTERRLEEASELLEQRVRDSVTELHSTREQLHAAQRLEALGRLAGGIAHDFNNMLSVILSAAGLARRKIGLEDVDRELHQIEIAADRAAVLTRQLLAFSRRQLLEPRSVSLNEVVAQTEPMLRRLLHENIAIRIRRAGDLKRTLVDPAQMEQVLVNLAVNSRDAMPDGGTLTIRTENRPIDGCDARRLGLPYPGLWVTLCVEDTGHGMAPEIRAHIFEPFFTTKDEGIGTGLGLPTVFGIVKQSGGQITCESEPARGARFTIYLPPTERIATVPQPERAADSVGGCEVVLVVEDDALVRRSACRVLAHKGYALLEAASAEEALELAREHGRHIDALLTDMVLPGIGGLELARAMRRERPALPVVCMSGYVHEAFGSGAQAEGVDFLTKPFEPEQLARKIRTAIDRLAASDHRIG